MFNDKSLRPMLLKEVDKPFQDKKFLYELKYDGIRALMHVSKDTIKIYTRNGNQVSALYPELQNIKKLVGNKKVIFDGEIVAFKNGVPSFSELSRRSYLKNKVKIENLMNEVPIVFICFDIIYEDKELINIPLIKRKEILNKYNDTNFFIKSPIYDDGIKLFKKVKKLDLEGIIAKEKNSLYYPGYRENCWLKIKNFKIEEFYVHGLIFNTNKYSLLLGEKKNNKLYYVGKVSITNNNINLASILKIKKSTNKFVNYNECAKYIEPIFKIKVHYIERTPSNNLRQPFIK